MPDTYTLTRAEWEDICEWITGGDDLNWWLDPANSGEDPAVSALAQRVHTLVYGPDGSN